MRVAIGFVCVTMLGLFVAFAQARTKPESLVKGVVTDINNARVPMASVTIESDGQRLQTKTGLDGTYSVRVQTGTYTISISRPGFCEVRRGEFVAQKHTEVQFDFQLWVCPSDDMRSSYHYVELDSVPHTHLKPLVLFGESQTEGDLEHFTGPIIFEGGLNSGRKYPVVFSFNLLTVRANSVSYNSRNHVLTANGDVVWREGADSGSGTAFEIKLNSSEPHPDHR
jgi:Carboxypeptidase regulatory-like domain